MTSGAAPAWRAAACERDAVGVRHFLLRNRRSKRGRRKRRRRRRIRRLRRRRRRRKGEGEWEREAPEEEGTRQERPDLVLYILYRTVCRRF